MGKKHIFSLLTVLFVAVPLLSTLFVLSPVTSAFAASNNSVAGHVYVLNNETTANSISAFNRAADGKLTFVGTTKIGGQGSGDVLDSQGSLILSSDKRWLFAVDAGSNQISVIGIGAHSDLHPASVSSSDGVHPISLTLTDHRLYVVNAGDGSHAANVAGFWVSTNGHLYPIKGSIQPLSTANPVPAQIQANPAGDTLIVTEQATNLLDSYQIHPQGNLSQPTFTASVGAVPLGFAFSPTSRSQFVVSDAGDGTVASYRLRNGQITLEDGPVSNQQIAPCWVVITNNGRFAYTANAGSDSVSGYSLSRTGELKPLTTAGTGIDPNEIVLTSNSHFLYVLDIVSATLSAFRVQDNGALKSVDLGSINLPSSLTGLAAD